MINTVEQDQVAVWSGSAVFITKSSYMINTVKQDQVAVWSGSAVFITKSSCIINTVEQDQASSMIRVCSVYRTKIILYD